MHNLSAHPGVRLPEVIEAAAPGNALKQAVAPQQPDGLKAAGLGGLNVDAPAFTLPVAGWMVFSLLSTVMLMLLITCLVLKSMASLRCRLQLELLAMLLVPCRPSILVHLVPTLAENIRMRNGLLSLIAAPVRACAGSPSRAGRSDAYEAALRLQQRMARFSS
ncbi:unnamed protein product [Prorocentrum cordatum]|uniref:Uncharacterized protein n=1 Tax=Prorocentrum cordatum TaxID=2364126 RepID=A0ABN9VHZ4_9DINO|nr:unnamed protein product [Polarella glacialis]